MQVQVDVVFASLTNRTFRHTHFALGHVNARLYQRISQVARSDRTEQLAFITGLGDQRQFDLGQLGSTCFSNRLALGSLGLKLGTLCFEGFDIVFGCRYGQAVRHQIVAAVARLDGDLVTQTAQFANVVEQNDFHLVNLYSVATGGQTAAEIHEHIDKGRQQHNQNHGPGGNQQCIECDQPQPVHTLYSDETVHQGDTCHQQRQPSQHGE